MNVLYITYDGVLEPLGEGQVVAYLEELSNFHSITLISYEKKKDRCDLSLLNKMQSRLQSYDIKWIQLPYHKSPSTLATLLDIICGIVIGFYIIKKNKIQIVHARSYVAGLIGHVLKIVSSVKFLFDIRGFWADERVDAGLWLEDGFIYNTVKKLERKFLESADHVVTLTNASIRHLNNFSERIFNADEISVIPTCVNLDKFQLKQDISGHEVVFGYVGSVGTWYLFDEMIQVFVILKQKYPNAKFLIVNKNDHAEINEALNRHKIDKSDVELVSTSHESVGSYIQRMSFASALIKPSFSKISSAPTKLAEYLACGVPCLANQGVGDVEEVLLPGKVGFVLKGFTQPELHEAVDNLVGLYNDPTSSRRCRQIAEELFSLTKGSEMYNKIYKKLG
jgi:glycosyltransferase involved in cell wall biosynthesis